MVVAVVFTITLQTAEAEKQFLEAFSVEQQHVIHNEPGTLTYELHQIFENGAVVPLKYLVVERYSNMRCFEDVHVKSAVFQKLFAAIGGMAVESNTLQVCNNANVQAKLDAMSQVWSTNDIEDPLLRKGVLVFCGARPGKRPAYAVEAQSLARCLVQDYGQPLVYGGGTVGVMGEVMQAVKALGGKIVSVIPSSLSPREVSGSIAGDAIYLTNTMAERKSIMFAHADTVVALPGGVGTFDELLEVITLFQLNAYRPKIGIVNVEGFFDPFFALLRHMIDEGFLEESVFEFMVIKPTAAEMMAALMTFVPPASHAASLVWTYRP